MTPPLSPHAPIEPVYLKTGEPEPAPAPVSDAGWGDMLGIVAAVLAMALLFAAGLRRRHRLRAAMDPADLALLSLSRRLRLGRRERAALRELASAHVAAWPRPVHPVALLVSRDAFETAAAATLSQSPEASAEITPAVIRIRGRAFGAASGPASR